MEGPRGYAGRDPESPRNAGPFFYDRIRNDEVDRAACWPRSYPGRTLSSPDGIYAL